jgi:hypothetical protein
VHLDFLFFYCRGGEGWRYGVLIFPSLEMWKEEGGKGLIGLSRNVFFIVERVGGYFFAQIDYGGRGRLKHTGLQQKGCTLIYFYFIFYFYC